MAIGHYYLDSPDYDPTVYLYFDGAEHYYDKDGWDGYEIDSYEEFSNYVSSPIQTIEGKTLDEIKLKIERMYPEINL